MTCAACWPAHAVEPLWQPTKQPVKSACPPGVCRPGCDCYGRPIATVLPWRISVEAELRRLNYYVPPAAPAQPIIVNPAPPAMLAPNACDPAILAALARLQDQSAQILAILLAQRIVPQGATPVPPQVLIVSAPAPAAPLQLLTPGVPVSPTLPIIGTPLQVLTPGGSPLQTIPIPGSPLHILPIPGAPQLIIPPSPGQPLQVLPIGPPSAGLPPVVTPLPAPAPGAPPFMLPVAPPTTPGAPALPVVPLTNPYPVPAVREERTPPASSVPPPSGYQRYSTKPVTVSHSLYRPQAR